MWVKNYAHFFTQQTVNLIVIIRLAAVNTDFAFAIAVCIDFVFHISAAFLPVCV